MQESIWKKGGPAHQRVIQEAKAHFEQLGYEVYEEVLIKTPGGYKNKRFVDLLVTDGIHSFGIQVGRNGTRGFPVARELRAIADLIDVLEAVFFIAYNQEDVWVIKFIFCNQKKITGIETDVSPEYVKELIEKSLLTMDENYLAEVAFFGGSFTGLKKEVQEDYDFVLAGK